jgi:hypothetical protein
VRSNKIVQLQSDRRADVPVGGSRRSYPWRWVAQHRLDHGWRQVRPPVERVRHGVGVRVQQIEQDVDGRGRVVRPAAQDLGGQHDVLAQRDGDASRR